MLKKMNKIVLRLTILFLGSQLIFSCSSGDKVLSQFSKRKYLKKYKKEKVKHEDDIDQYEYALESSEIKNERWYELSSNIEEIEEIDNSVVVFENDLSTIEENFASTPDEDKTFNESVNTLVLEELEVDTKMDEKEVRTTVSEPYLPDEDVVFVVLVVLAMKEDDITNNFWINLLLWLLGFGVLSIGFLGLFWLAAIIHALLVVFEEI